MCCGSCQHLGPLLNCYEPDEAGLIPPGSFSIVWRERDDGRQCVAWQSAAGGDDPPPRGVRIV